MSIYGKSNSKCNYETYKKSEIDTLLGAKADSSDLSDYKLKGEFAVVSGTTDKTSLHTEVNYPEGFSYSNCVALALLIKPNGVSYYYLSSVMQNGSGTKFDINVQLTNSQITVWDSYSKTNNESFDFKIVLMKI